MVYNKKELGKAFSPHHGGRRLSRRKPATISANSLQSTSNMKVVIRVRPMMTTEQENSNRCIVKAMDDKMLVFDPQEEAQPFFFHGVKQNRRDMTKRPHKEMEFVFDQVFDQGSTNFEVYEGSTKGIITSLLDGFNCSVFVYGATGAGKTYTMLGSKDNHGITYLTVVELFSQITTLQDHRNFELWVSYLEVYNENVHDLLKPNQPPLHIREDGNCGVVVTALTVKTIKNADELLNLLTAGNKNRTQHPTDANAESSRSHAVFQLYIRMTNKLTSQIKQVKLSMIDLAGSERGSATGFKGMRFTEGANINKSLLALGNCINGLADGLKHIPYRDSKLTRILKDSLGGNCQTVMIANVSPVPHSYEDTYNTLKYATRAKKIKSKIQRNIVSVEMHVAQYINMVEELKREIAALKEAKPSTSAHKDEENIPINVGEELQSWKDRVSACYKEKSALHVKIMRLERMLKSVQYRWKMKDTIGKLLREIHFKPCDLQKSLSRVYESLSKFRKQEDVYQQRISQFHSMEKEATANVDKILEDLETADLANQLKEFITIQNLQLENRERDQEILHLQQLVATQQSQLESQNHVISELSQSLKDYHHILDGNNKMTKAMDTDYLKLARAVESIKVLSWGQIHESTLEEVGEGDQPADIPARMRDSMSLSFTGRHYEAAHNISRLDASKEESPPSPPPMDYASFEDYFASVTRGWGGDRVAFSPRAMEEDEPAPTPVGPRLNVAELNSTFVLHDLEESREVGDHKAHFLRQAVTNLKRGLAHPHPAKMVCNKENKLKDGAVFLKPGPCVPKAPRIMKLSQPRTPLGTRPRPNIPSSVSKDTLKINRVKTRPVYAQGHPYNRQMVRPSSSQPKPTSKDAKAFE